MMSDSFRNTWSRLVGAVGTVLEVVRGKRLIKGASTMSESEESIKSAAELAAERASRLQEQNEGDAVEPGMSQEQTQAEPVDELSALKLKLASVTEELEAQKDKAMRLVAEFDNFRRRTAREQLEYLDLAQAKAFGELFPVVDNFERAFTDAPAEGEWTPADPAAFAKGMRLIRDQLRKVLADAGIEEIPSEGAAFDPNLHDALTQMPHETVEKDFVIQAFARGWKKGEKILRHAQVVVSSGPAA
jgi:molecular chaperone GrpE